MLFLVIFLILIIIPAPPTLPHHCLCCAVIGCLTTVHLCSGDQISPRNEEGRGLSDSLYGERKGGDDGYIWSA